MPVAATDIEWWNKNGGNGERGSSFTPGVDNNVFPDLSAAQLIAGGTTYRKIFASNENVADDAVEVIARIALSPGGYVLSIGLGFDDADDDDDQQGILDGTGDGVARTVELVSDGADTRDVTVFGVDADGLYLEETITLNGAAPVTTTGEFLRVYALRADSIDASRTVTASFTSAGGIGDIVLNTKNSWWWLDNTRTLSVGTIVGSGGLFGMWLRLTWGSFAPAGTIGPVVEVSRS